MNFIENLLKKYFYLEKNDSKDLGEPKKILIVRPHNQLGDMLASVPIFRALKEKFPSSKITLIVSPQNKIAVTKNKFINRIILFDKKKIYNPFELLKFLKILKENYDLAIVPVTVSISFTSNLLARISNSKIRIGISELSGMKNNYDYFFDRRVKMDWRKFPDQNVYDFCLEILRPFGIDTTNLRSEINFDLEDEKVAENFINSIEKNDDELLIGLHVGAGKPPNRWNLNKFIQLTGKINSNYKAKFYLTGTNADQNEIDYVKENCKIKLYEFTNKTIPELAALISKSDLFITNDTGVMHVAGSTKTSQVSIFGPTNPFNWAPIGLQKTFIRKSDLIDDVEVDEVYTFCDFLLSETTQK